MASSTKRKEIIHFFHKEQLKLNNFVQKLAAGFNDLESEDIVQDVMLNIFDKHDVAKPIENISAYVYQSLRNRIIDLVRKRKEEVSFEGNYDDENSLKLADILHDARYNTVSEFEKKEIQQKLYKEIDKLNDQDRAIIIATEFENYTFRELSEKWEIPLGTLLARKSRALKKLKSKLSQFVMKGEYICV
jgi:RNA polymerase sigma factor (sigma-70 family)